jgi:prepilin-type N-terminal cleavage/methylation domain-containing protein
VENVEKDVSNRGFSLIEALLALAVVSVLVLGTGQVLIKALAFKKAVDEQAEAVASRREVERLKAASFERRNCPGERSKRLRRKVARFHLEWRIERFPTA